MGPRTAYISCVRASPPLLTKHRFPCLGLPHQCRPAIDLVDIEPYPQFVLQNLNMVGSDAAEVPLFEEFDKRKVRVGGQLHGRMLF